MISTVTAVIPYPILGIFIDFFKKNLSVNQSFPFELTACHIATWDTTKYHLNFTNIYAYCK